MRKCVGFFFLKSTQTELNVCPSCLIKTFLLNLGQSLGPAGAQLGVARSGYGKAFIDHQFTDHYTSEAFVSLGHDP